MADELKDYAGGWITEKKGTGVPTFLKFAYIAIMAGCVGYLVIYMNGEINHEDRGALVRQFNSMTGSNDGFMYVVAGLAAIYAVILVMFAFKNKHED